MQKQGGVILTLLRVIFRRPSALVGATMFALFFPLLLVAVFIDLLGGIENPYFSLFIYLLLGPISIVALVLLVAGFIRIRKRQGGQGHYTYDFFKEQLTNPDHCRRIRRLVYVATFFISLFLIFMGIVTYSGRRFADSIQFCGTVCHTVMAPEFVTFNNSPHSRVSCVACHIKQDAQGVTKAKFSGLKQLYATFFNSYARPLKTPLNNLRPTRQTCEECHRPEKFHGQKLTFIDTFLPDEANSHVRTTMIIKIGSAGSKSHFAHGIHWHISEQHKLYYVAADKARQQIIRVELENPDGHLTVYYKRGVAKTAAANQKERLMDCLDCHNRPTHVFLAPGPALDRKILAGQISVELPFIKREALAAITPQYPDTQTALREIAERLRGWYASHYPELAVSRRALIDQAIAGAQQAYAENVFPQMNIHWNTYQSFIGHRNDGGCFRCHNGSLESADGKIISRDCDLCHVILAKNAPVGNVPETMPASGR